MEEYDDIQLIGLLTKAFEAEKKKNPNARREALKAHAMWRKEKGIDSYWIHTGKDKNYATR